MAALRKSETSELQLRKMKFPFFLFYRNNIIPTSQRKENHVLELATLAINLNVQLEINV